MKGNKIAIDRYLETGEVVDSLDLSVNYLVKSTREGGTVPLPAINILTWSKVTTNPSPSDLITVTNMDTSIDFDNVVAPSGYPYIYKIQGNLYTTISQRSWTAPNSIKYIVECSLPFVTSIRSNAFNGCANLSSVNIPRVISIGSSAFQDTLISSIDIPNATTLDNQAFYNCKQLSSIVAPNLENGANNIFGETAVATIELPNLISVPQNMCSYCQNLTHVDVPNATSISFGAFQSCSSLNTIKLPKVSSIDRRVFDNCSSLNEIYVGTGLEEVCSLINVDAIPSNVYRIYVPASLVDAYKSATNWSSFASKIEPYYGEIQSLSIEADNVSGRETTTNIRWTAIYEEITKSGHGLSNPFPQNTSTTDSVTREVSFTKDGLTSTTTITQGVWVDNNIITWSKVPSNPTSEDLMTETNTDTSIDFDTVTAPVDYPYMYRIDSYSYTQIEDRASSTPAKTRYIYDCYAPKVTSIGSYAFRNGENLTIAEFPKAVTINSHAFRSCSKLVSMNLPKVTSLGTYVFYSASNLRELIIGVESSTVCTISDSSLPSSLQSIYVPDSLVDSYKSATNWSTYADKIKGISERPTT